MSLLTQYGNMGRARIRLAPVCLPSPPRRLYNLAASLFSPSGAGGPAAAAAVVGSLRRSRLGLHNYIASHVLLSRLRPHYLLINLTSVDVGNFNYLQ